ncbi:glycoside hydrolase family 88 protein [Proteiniphilum sp. UBA5384]|uniref:glycoside hydrolase family 88 protein n=1 Tax=Proteiniphilum sp. UBA5384 TaxID=1947279 RepID=UPI0025DE26AE|nr:glycoside hydrolase family 88 protein [Proteiniphilum sp. UBA5384]
MSGIDNFLVLVVWMFLSIVLTVSCGVDDRIPDKRDLKEMNDDSSSWKETSGTAMSIYAMIVGIKNDWLDGVIYGAAARSARFTLLTYLDQDSNISNVCEGTNAKNGHQYYLGHKRNTGDLHGQAPLLWCAHALYETARPR